MGLLRLSQKSGGADMNPSDHFARKLILVPGLRILTIGLFASGFISSLGATQSGALSNSATQNESPETLASAIASAYERNPGLQARRAGSRAVDEGIRQAEAAFGPTLSISGTYEYRHDRFHPSTVSPIDRSGFTSAYAADVNQPLFTSGLLSARLKSAQIRSAAGRHTLRAGEMDLLASVVVAYVSVLRDGDLVEIARQNVRLLQSQQQQTSERLRFRDATATDLAQTDTRLQNALGQLELATGNLEASRDTYRNLVGHYPRGPLAPLPPLPDLPPSIEDAYSSSEVNNPEYRISLLNEEDALAELAAARAEAGPVISLVGEVGRTPLTPYDDTIRRVGASAGVRLSMPLYTSGFNSSRVRQATARYERDAFLVEQTRRDVRQALSQDWGLLDKNRRALPLYRAAVESAADAVRGARRQELAGQLTALDVLEAARDLLQSNQAAAQTLAASYILHVRLLRDIGVLDVDAFAETRDRYDPDVYIRSVGEWSGLPTGPLVQLLDSLALDASAERPAIEIENDSERKPMASPPAPNPAMAPIVTDTETSHVDRNNKEAASEPLKPDPAS